MVTPATWPTITITAMIASPATSRPTGASISRTRWGATSSPEVAPMPTPSSANPEAAAPLIQPEIAAAAARA